MMNEMVNESAFYLHVAECVTEYIVTKVEACSTTHVGLTEQATICA